MASVDGTLSRHPSYPCSSQPTCWELSSSDSKTPNPRPIKTMRMEESSNPSPPPIPPPSSSEVVVAVVDEASTPVVKDESSKEKPTERAEQERMEDDDDDDDDDSWVFDEWGEEDDEVDIFGGDRSYVLPVSSSPEVKKCNICEDGHHTMNCPYWREIPPDKTIANYQDYMIVCVCGMICEDGRCRNKCFEWMPKRVVRK